MTIFLIEAKKIGAKIGYFSPHEHQFGVYLPQKLVHFPQLVFFETEYFEARK